MTTKTPHPYPPVVRDFNSWFLTQARGWQKLSWRGVRAQKNPCDLLVYQMLIHRIRPRWIIELGTFMGGTALFLADMLTLCEIDGQVITVDIAELDRPSHPRITYIHGSSISRDVVAQIRTMVAGGGACMVIADSSHAAPHVTHELDFYSPLVTVGSYFVVEDTSRDAWRTDTLPSGLISVVYNFVDRSRGQFVIDMACEPFGMTASPQGFLKRIA